MGASISHGCFHAINQDVYKSNFTTYINGILPGSGVSVLKFSQNLDPIWHRIYYRDEDISQTSHFSIPSRDSTSLFVLIRAGDLVDFSGRSTVLKLDLNGNIVWQKIYPTSNGNQFLKYLAEQDNGNLLLVGFNLTSPVVDSLKSEITFTMLNPKGEVIWSKYLGGKGNESLDQLSAASDLIFHRKGNEIVFFAESDGFKNNDLFHPVLMKINTQGEVLKAVMVLDSVTNGWRHTLKYHYEDSSLFVLSNAYNGTSDADGEHLRVIKTDWDLNGICNSIDITDSLHEYFYDQPWKDGDLKDTTRGWEYLPSSIDYKPFDIFQQMLCFCNAYARFTWQQTGQNTLQFQNNSLNTTQYTWHFGDGTTSNEPNPGHTFADTGKYTVILTAANDSCGDTLSHIVEVLPEDVWVPNVFSPNGDGINDFLEIKSWNLRSFYLTIYNRWGNLLFTTTTASDFWNGKHHNRELSTGTYFYAIKATAITGKQIEKRGFVELIRD